MIRNQKNTPNKEKPLLLVAPLDWGLGHTTRVVPLIAQLLELGCRVVVACNSTQKAVLQQEFPTLEFVLLEGYGIGYGHTRTATRLRLLLYTPKILTKVKNERLWFLRYLAQNRVDAVISDNRYGLYHKDVPGIFITHQLNIISGFGRVADALIRKLLYWWLKRFTECWVPDNSKPQISLAGKLSHPVAQPSTPVRYIGILSRLEPCKAGELSSILIILSGPEPQRTLLEKRVFADAASINEPIILVRAKPGSNESLVAPPNVRVINHADAKTLNTLACAARLVISRAGYTTIMDMIKLKKKMVVVPTPGQAEQEYLALHLSSSRIAASLSQEHFSLGRAISLGTSFSYNIPNTDTAQYKEAVREFIASLFSP